MNSKIKLSSQIISQLSTQDRMTLLQKYDEIAQSIQNNSQDELVKRNLGNYCFLLNKTAYLTIMLLSKPTDLVGFKSLMAMYNHAVGIEKTQMKAYIAILAALTNKVQKLGGTVRTVIDFTGFLQALRTLDIEEIDPNMEVDVEDLSETDEEMFKELFRDEGETEEPENEHEGEVENEADSEQEEPVNEQEKAEEEQPTIIIEKEEDETFEEDADFEDKKKALLNSSFGAFIKKSADELVKAMSALYKSSFTSMPSVGILTENGDSSPLIQLKAVDKGKKYVPYSEDDDGTIIDAFILHAIKSVAPNTVTKGVIAEGEVMPDINVMSDIDTVVCPRLHMMFQTANIIYSKGKYSIRKWITKEKLPKSSCTKQVEWLNKHNKGNKTKLCKFDHVREWYKWCIINIMLDTMVQCGVTGMAQMMLGKEILNKIDKNMRNVISVVERTTGSKTVIRIGTANDIDTEKLIKAIKDNLNVGSSEATVVNIIAQEDYDNYRVLNVNILLNPEAEKQATMFAADVLDNIIKGGQVPSWGNALLGKLENGQNFFWEKFQSPDAKQQQYRCYSIYAGTRSGKGIMTSTLVASALCDRKHVFYTDGKPENGACLGEIAWKEQKEAYVFDGQMIGKEPYSGQMESYTYGMRNPLETAQYLDKLPAKLFENPKFFNTEMQRVFLGVMRYIKSISLCARIARSRAEGIIPNIKDNWQIWIFDEMTSMSKNERKVRGAFADYVRSLTGETLNTKNADSKYKINLKFKNIDEIIDPNSDKYDEGIHYIHRWLAWMDSIKDEMSDICTINLGKADMNIIFIFQEANWIQDHLPTTTIAAMVNQFQTTKIVGNGGIKPLGGVYGDGTTLNTDWYSKICSGKGWWGISHKVDVRAGVTIFKPYSVWTTPLLKGTDTRDPNGAKPGEETRYLAGYVDKLLSNFGVKASDLLQEAYDYADNFCRTTGLSETGLKEYIYNCANIEQQVLDASFEKTKQEIDKSAQGAEQQGDGFNIYSSDDINEDDESNTDTFFNNDEDDDDEEIDFGGPVEDEENYETEFVDPDGNPVGNEQAQENTEQAKAGGESNENKPDAAEEEIIKNLKLVDTITLMNKGYSNTVLLQYINKIVFKYLENNRFDYSDRDAKSTSGLKVAAVLLSNLHYCAAVRQCMDINIFRQHFNKKITDGDVYASNFKMALGMLDDYDACELNYDVMPDMAVLRKYLSTGMETATPQPSGTTAWAGESTGMGTGMGDSQPILNEEDLNLNEDKSVPISDEAVPDEVVVNMQPCYKINRDGTICIVPRSTQTILLTPPNSFSSVDIPKYSIIEKFSKRLFESRNGTAYEFKKRWDFVLDSIEDLFPQKSLVTRIAIVGDNVSVNGKTIRLDKVLGGEYDIRLEDIIFIKRTLKRFKYVQELILDSCGTQTMISEFGPGVEGAQKMFNEHKNLMRIGLIPAGAAKPIVYSREALAANAEKLKRQLEVEQTKIKMEHFANSRDTRLSKKSPGCTARFFKNSANLSGSLFKGAKNAITADKNPKLIKAAAYSVVGTAIIGVGSVIGVVGLTARGIKGFINMFRK